MKLLSARAGYLLSLLLLPWLLGGCSVYDHFFHPHRLATPPMTASAKAKYKAAEKARHKGLTLGAPATDGTAKPANADASAASGGGGTEAAAPAEPAPTAAAEPTKTADEKNKDIAEMLGHTYDKKTGLIKRSMWQRMEANSHKLHHYDLRAPSHTKATRAERKLRKHPKGKGKAAPGPQDGAEPADAAPEPAPDPTQPAEAQPAAAKPAAKPKPTAKPKSAAKPAARPALKPRTAAKPTPTPKAPKTPPTEGMLPGTGRVRQPAPEPAPEEKAPKQKKEKPAKEKKPKRDQNGNKLPKPDPTQPLTGQD